MNNLAVWNAYHYIALALQECINGTNAQTACQYAIVATWCPTPLMWPKTVTLTSVSSVLSDILGQFKNIFPIWSPPLRQQCSTQISSSFSKRRSDDRDPNSVWGIKTLRAPAPIPALSAISPASRSHHLHQKGGCGNCAYRGSCLWLLPRCWGPGRSQSYNRYHWCRCLWFLIPTMGKLNSVLKILAPVMCPVATYNLQASILIPSGGRRQLAFRPWSEIPRNVPDLSMVLLLMIFYRSRPNSLEIAFDKSLIASNTPHTLSW